SRRRHTRFSRDWSSDVCSSDLLSLRPVIEQEALAYAVASISPAEIDRINIHNASYRAMHLALNALKVGPEFILVDGNRFIPYPRSEERRVGKECRSRRRARDEK